MSMPTFPTSIPDVGQERAINQILASIALEEISMSHILNSEGEKIQFVLGTLVPPTGSVGLRDLVGNAVTIDDLVAINDSVTRTLQAAAAYQTALLEKLRAALETVEGTEDEP